MQITYEAKGLSRLVQKLNDAPNSLIGPPLRRGLTTSALLVEGEAKRLVPVDTGNLRRTITHRVDRSPVPTFAMVGTNAPYAIVVHEGRRAGQPQPPTQALLGWARRHGIPARAAYVIARKIGRRGIKGRPFLRQAFQAMRGQIDNALREAAREIESRWNAR